MNCQTASANSLVSINGMVHHMAGLAHLISTRPAATAPHSPSNSSGQCFPCISFRRGVNIKKSQQPGASKVLDTDMAALKEHGTKTDMAALMEHGTDV